MHIPRDGPSKPAPGKFPRENALRLFSGVAMGNTNSAIISEDYMRPLFFSCLIFGENLEVLTHLLLSMPRDGSRNHVFFLKNVTMSSKIQRLLCSTAKNHNIKSLYPQRLMAGALKTKSPSYPSFFLIVGMMCFSPNPQWRVYG